MNLMQTVAQFLPLILIVIIFYFFIIRPQNQRRKELAEMIRNLKVGDKVIISSGIIGTIEKIENESFILSIYDGSKMEILKNSVISLFNEKNQ